VAPVVLQVAVAPDTPPSFFSHHTSMTNPDSNSGFVLLIAPALSYRVSSYINAVQNLNYQLLVVSDSKHSLISQIASGITVDFADHQNAIKTILNAVKDLRILTVIATDDSVTTIASHIANKLALPHNDPQSSILTYRKDLARERLKIEGCNVPEFKVCHFSQIESLAQSLSFPVVLKPLMLSGSRGVIRVNNTSEFIQAAKTIQQILQYERGNDFEKSHFLIESFLVGEEFAFDGFVKNGRLIPLALFDKPEPLNGPYFEESFYITPSNHSPETQKQIISEIEKCCHAYGLVHGPIHAEVRLTENGPYLIEIASRTIGGQCAQTIEYVLGARLEEIIIQLACEPTIEIRRSNLFAGVLMIPIQQEGLLKRVEGMTKAQQIQYVSSIEIHIQPGYELIPLPRGSSYLGFIFAQAPDFDITYQALKQAHQALKFVTVKKWGLTAR
jgi:biotin carboxylase